MNKTEQAQQLRLAAELIETGHPWELETVTDWHPSSKTLETPLHCIFHGQKIRPVLATPPDGRPLHNPDNLSAEQVGIGYRLGLQEEAANQPHEVWRSDKLWRECLQGMGAFGDYEFTYRVPLSVPWPEAKPEAPQFQLPPPPPGMRWHREDGWKEGDLPQGYRPLVEGEQVELGPEDVPPGSVLRGPTDDSKVWAAVTSLGSWGVRLADARSFPYKYLRDDCWQINRSIPLTGKWGANAWEPCHKMLANG